jgi:hypothetical protein
MRSNNRGLNPTPETQNKTHPDVASLTEVLQAPDRAVYPATRPGRQPGAATRGVGSSPVAAQRGVGDDANGMSIRKPRIRTAPSLTCWPDKRALLPNMPGGGNAHGTRT